MMQRIYILFFLVFPLLLNAQGRRADEKPPNLGTAFLVHLGYGIHNTGEDLRERFGPSNSMMLGTEFILKSNYIFGAQANFYFGKNVNEDPVSIIRTADGNIIGNNLGLAMFVLRQRGLSVGAHVGKLFPFGNTRTGIRLTFGAGYTQHKIRLQDDGQSIVQIFGDYEKGYDRLTGGLGLTQFVGFQRIPLRRGFTCILGFEMEEGLTKSLRDWDFSTKMKDERNRFDFRYGIRFGFSLSFHGFGNAGEIIY